jgi:ribosome-binding factor A
MNKDRQKKIERLIRKITSDFIIQKLPDEDNIFGIINVSEIILSSD